MPSKWNNGAVFGWVVVCAILVGLGIVSGTVLAGSLDPPPTAFDASGNPVPTPAPQPSWSQDLPANDGDPTTGCHSTRFKCVLPTTANPDGEAVLDNQTGLVWERSPDITGGPNQNGSRMWTPAIHHCATRTVGGHKGWGLPMRNQLASLVDPSNNNPALPTGHPFNQVQSSIYWSATTAVFNPTLAWVVVFLNGNVDTFVKTPFRFVWCVRGGQTFDGQDNQRVIDALTP